MRYSCVPQPYSIYEGDQKAITRSFCRAGDACEPDLLLVYERTCHRGVRSPLCVPKERAVSKLENTLQDAVKKQMQADVPLGAFVWGVDSSLIVALMQEQSSCPINTFSIGFEDQKFNEAPFAKKVARHLGTDHWSCMCLRQRLVVLYLTYQNI